MAQRDLFNEVYSGLCSGGSFVLHGPYQCGKTTFLWALLDKLDADPDISCVIFDMSMVKGWVSTYGEKDGFYKFISFRTFHVALDEGGLIQRLDQQRQRRQRLCFLVDELEYIFDSDTLLSVAKNFFRSLSSYQNISYVAVGTYCIVDLMTPDGSKFVSPFNKASFRQMPFFLFKEMGEIFQLYQRHLNPEGISLDIQANIVQESNGHPASFMILLKLFDEHRPDSASWGTVLQQYLGEYLNGTHQCIRQWLKKMDDLARDVVRELTN